MRRCPAAVAVILVAVGGCMPHWLLPRQVVKHVIADDPAAKPAPHPADPATPARKPRNVLALSGGGSYGAYTAGVLNGWTRSNTRPEFDVVTGISTGALIAPLAFLGPDYDDALRKHYTEVSQADVLKMRAWATIPFRESIAVGTPLRGMIEENLSDAVMRRVAAEHARGRRLYVATTNLETRRAVVWDIGAIASRDTKKGRTLIRDVILASCSIPGIFPPVTLTVEVDGVEKEERHVDGGVTGPVFVPPSVFDNAAEGPPGTTSLYIVMAGKFYPPPGPVLPRLLKVVSASGGAMMHAQMRRDVGNLYHMSLLNGVNFKVTALKQEFPAHDNGIQFHPKEMHRLYVEGVRVGYERDWQETPPERGPGETPEIRTGRKLTSGERE